MTVDSPECDALPDERCAAERYPVRPGQALPARLPPRTPGRLTGHPAALPRRFGGACGRTSARTGERETGKGPRRMNDTPSIEQMEQWMSEGGCEATNGYWVEPDGTGPHGKPSWQLHLGPI
jgi:hypothetical protein